MSRKLSFIVILTCLFTVVFALPFGSSLASERCTEDEIKKMNLPKERIAMICNIPVEQVVLVQKKKAEENEPTNTELTAKQNRWGPIVKELQLGMPYNEAIAALTRQSGNNIRINPRITSGGNIDIYLKDETGRDYLSRYDNLEEEYDNSPLGEYFKSRLSSLGKRSDMSAGHLYVNSGVVTSIVFGTRLVNALFKAYDVKTPNFVKAFAEHYGMKEWQPKIERTKLDVSGVSRANSILTQEVWTFQGEGFTVKVSRTIPSYFSVDDQDIKDKMDHDFAREKHLDLTIKTPKTIETSPDGIDF